MNSSSTQSNLAVAIITTGNQLNEKTEGDNDDKTIVTTANKADGTSNDDQVLAVVYRKHIEDTRHQLVASFADAFHEAACRGDLTSINIVIAEIQQQLAPTPIHQPIFDLLTRHLANYGEILKRKVTPLIGACVNGHLDVISFLIDDLNADILQPDEIGLLAIHVAVEMNQKQVVKALLKRKPELLEAKYPPTNETPLNKAAFCGHFKIVIYLVAKMGADIANKGCFNRTPLMDAALNGHLEIVQFLFDKTAKTDDKSLDHSLSLAAYYATMNDHLAVVRFLLQQRPNLATTVQDTKNDHLLHLAAFTGHLDLVRFFVDDLKVDLELKGCSGRTVLLTAVFRGHIDVVRFLVEKGANLEAMDETELKSTAIHLAVQQGDLAIVAYLLKVKPQLVAAQAGNMDTPLHRTAFVGNLDVAKVLVVDYHAPINLKTYDELTPLMISAKEGHFEIVEFLVEHGASLTLRSSPDTYHWLAIHFAASQGHVDIVDRLLITIPDLLEAIDSLQRTPLAIAAEFGRGAVVDFLVSCKKADKDSRDIFNRTPLMMAVMNKHDTVACFLRDCGAGEDKKIGMLIAKTKQLFSKISK